MVLGHQREAEPPDADLLDDRLHVAAADRRARAARGRRLVLLRPVGAGAVVPGHLQPGGQGHAEAASATQAQAGAGGHGPCRRQRPERRATAPAESGGVLRGERQRQRNGRVDGRGRGERGRDRGAPARRGLHPARRRDGQRARGRPPVLPHGAAAGLQLRGGAPAPDRRG